MTHQKISSLFFTFLSATVCLFGQGGALNEDFGEEGTVVTSFEEFASRLWDVAILPDGEIIAVGSVLSESNQSDFAVVKYHADGSIDSNFGNEGKVSLDFFGGHDFCQSVVVQPDGKIMLAGPVNRGLNFEYGLTRFDADGLIDNTFGTGGKVTVNVNPGFDNATSVLLQANGKILLGGSNRGLGNGDDRVNVLRFNLDGTLDTTFGTNGIAEMVNTYDCTGLGLQSNGKIVANAKFLNTTGSGSFEDQIEFAVLRFNAAGIIDSTFGSNGLSRVNVWGVDDPNALHLQPDDKIIIAGDSEVNAKREASIIRFNVDGEPDSDFGSNGAFTYDVGFDVTTCTAVSQQEDGKIIATGRSANLDESEEKMYVLRLLENGTLDPSFGDDGIVFFTVGPNTFEEGAAIAYKPDNTITVGGYVIDDGNTDFMLVQFVSEIDVGALDFSTTNNEMAVYPNPVVEHVTLKYTLTQSEEISIDLHSTNGTLIKSFLSRRERGAGAHEEQLHFDAALPGGSYVLTIRNGAGQVGFRVVK